VCAGAGGARMRWRRGGEAGARHRRAAGIFTATRMKRMRVVVCVRRVAAIRIRASSHTFV
jgi:hypothetical protein